jgi:excisionase family DNA binding protein
MADKKNYLTTSEAAKFLSVSPDTVLKWAKAGKVKSTRTLGGHFRIPISELDTLATKTDRSNAVSNGTDESVIRPLVHQYCWEYLSGGGEIKDQCRDCITFRSRARRCYELKDLPGGMGCLNIMCDTECAECEYFRLMNGKALNIMILSNSKSLVKDTGSPENYPEFQVRFAGNEYDAAVVIQNFRPDYIVVDCAFGKKRTGSICTSIFDDIRIPVPRIILSSRAKDINDYCDREVFGWLRKPFTMDQLKDCIWGVPGSREEKNE